MENKEATKNNTEAISGESRKIFCKMKTFLLMVWILVWVMQVREAEGAAGSRGDVCSFPLKDIQNLSAVVLKYLLHSFCVAEIERKREKVSDTFWSGVRKAGRHSLALTNGSAMWPPTRLSCLQENTVDTFKKKPAFQLWGDPQGKQAISQAE